jgi:hypothetical protein
LWLNKRLNSVQLESFLSQKSHCFELHFDLFREKAPEWALEWALKGRWKGR